MQLAIRCFVFLFLLAAVPAHAATVFSDDFQDGNFNGWTIGGTGASAVQESKGSEP